jgi:hypothetical protein
MQRIEYHHADQTGLAGQAGRHIKTQLDVEPFSSRDGIDEDEVTFEINPLGILRCRYAGVFYCRRIRIENRKDEGIPLGAKGYDAFERRTWQAKKK